MKFNFFISILLFSLSSCVNSNDLDPNTVPLNVLDVENHQMLKLLEDNPGVLVDVSTPKEISKGFMINPSYINFCDKNLC